LRTNCSDAARISSSVAAGSKLKRVLMFRHISLCLPLAYPARLGCEPRLCPAGTAQVKPNPLKCSKLPAVTGALVVPLPTTDYRSPLSSLLSVRCPTKLEDDEKP
jgi:hypothetical protein